MNDFGPMDGSLALAVSAVLVVFCFAGYGIGKLISYRRKRQTPSV